MVIGREGKGFMSDALRTGYVYRRRWGMFVSVMGKALLRGSQKNNALTLPLPPQVLMVKSFSTKLFYLVHTSPKVMQGRAGGG